MSKKIKIPSENIRYRLVDLFHIFISNRYESHYRGNHLGRSFYEDMDDDEILYWKSQGFIFDGIDDDYANYYEDDVNDDDDSCVIWPPNPQGKKKGSKHKKDAYESFWEEEERHHKKKHKRGSRGSKARLIDINQPYSGDEDNPDEVGDYPHEFDDYEEVDDNGLTNGKEIYYYPDYHNKDNRLEFSTLKAFNDFCDDNGFSVPMHVASEIAFRRISHCCLRPDAREYGMYEIMAEESYGVMFYEVCEDAELGG